MSSEQRAASLLSLISSKALVPGGFAGITTTSQERSDGEVEEQRAQTLMYAARMKYLRDSDTVKPDTMFMTRKQAQKLAKQDTMATLSLKKLDVSSKASNGIGGGEGKGNASGPAINSSPNLKKQRWVGPLVDCQQTWVAVRQAGCHFWQSQETGECRSVAPRSWEGRNHPDTEDSNGDDGSEDEEDPPFPQSFAFLNTHETSK